MFNCHWLRYIHWCICKGLTTCHCRTAYHLLQTCRVIDDGTFAIMRTSHSTSKNIISIPRKSRSRVTRSAGIVETAEPTRVMDSSERSSDPLGYRTATPVRDPQEAAIEDAVVTDSPTRVVDSSERSSEPLEHPPKKMTNANNAFFKTFLRCFHSEKIPKISLPSILIMIKQNYHFIHKSRPIWMQNARHMIRNEHFASRLDETYEWS